MISERISLIKTRRSHLTIYRFIFNAWISRIQVNLG